MEHVAIEKGRKQSTEHSSERIFSATALPLLQLRSRPSRQCSVCRLLSFTPYILRILSDKAPGGHWGSAKEWVVNDHV